MQYQDVVVPAQVFPVEAKEDTPPYMCLPILTLSPATRQRSAQRREQFSTPVEYIKMRKYLQTAKLHCLQQNCN